MEEKERREYEHELFGNVIFSYTDAQAVEDGVLFDVTPYTVDKVNRVTASVYALLDGFDKPGEVPKLYREMEDHALRALSQSKDKELVEFTYRDKTLWLMDNETGGRTIMFPEDY